MTYPEAHIDEHGRIIRLQMDHAVDRNSQHAVQVPVEIHSTDDWVAKGNVDQVLDADHPLAVQALPPEEHPWLDRLSPEDRELAETRRAAANEAQIGTGHPEGEYDLPPADQSEDLVDPPDPDVD